MVLRSNEAFKFALLVALNGMFIDASIGHGLFWRNDPFWTYWVTDTFLITTIFTIGCAFLGIGMWQGFVLVGVQMLILETYYGVLSPVGLPEEPWWLSVPDVWTIGIVTHYLVYLVGFFIALFVWNRRTTDTANRTQGARGVALTALAAVVAILILDGLITEGFMLRTFPGVTFFVQRLVIGFVFLFAWFMLVGWDSKGIVTGALLLSLLWLTYNMYLGPIGLPGRPTYLSYNRLWLDMFPGALVSALIGLAFVRRFMVPRGVRA